MSDLRLIDPLRSIEYGDYIRHLHWSEDGTHLLIGETAGGIGIVHLNGGATLTRTIAHATELTDVRWLGCDGLVISSGRGSKKGELRCWRIEDGEIRLQWCSSLSGLAAAELLRPAHDGSGFLSAAGRIITWCSLEGTEVSRFEGARAAICDLQWRDIQDSFISVSHLELQIWKQGSSRPARTFNWNGSPLQLSVSPDGRWIASGCRDQTLHVWRTSSGNDFRMSGFPGQVRALRWSPDGSQLLAAGGEAITSWDFTRATPAGQQPRVIGGHIGTIVDIGFRPASPRQFATIGTDGCWMLWSLDSIALRPMVIGTSAAESQATCMAWHPSGNSIAVGFDTGELALWELPADLRSDFRRTHPSDDH